ncbi:carbohydrate sulfotransferase 11-like [Antedon mediterranea]|uniref:carbohydrate sulfotransferase 11-like n=1 Tax=Antedon mediterranea TaxID=105859 RepID=UPI003AF6D17C
MKKSGPTGMFMERQRRIQSQRVSHLKEACDTRHPELKNAPVSTTTEKHMFVNHNIRGIYCFIPKVACSNWKRVMMVLNGYPKEIEDITGPEAHELNGLPLLSSLSNAKKAHVLANYTKFMIVREPFLRILSAFKNKFEMNFDRRTNTIFQRFAKKIMRKYRQKASRSDLSTGRGLKFNEFVSYLTDPAQITKFEAHWQEMYKLCSPCKVNYDYIVKLETIKDDSDFILKSFKVSHLAKFPPADVQKGKPTNSSGKYDTSYRKLSPELINKLWDVYKTDFDLFNYSKPEYLF